MDEAFVPMSIEDAFKVFDVEVPESIEHPELSVDEAKEIIESAE